MDLASAISKKFTLAGVDNVFLLAHTTLPTHSYMFFIIQQIPLLQSMHRVRITTRTLKVIGFHIAPHNKKSIIL